MNFQFLENLLSTKALNLYEKPFTVVQHKIILKMSQNLQQNTCTETSILIKSQVLGLQHD